MHETHLKAQDFLNEFIEHAGLSLKATALPNAEGSILNLEGEDVSYLMGEGGEFLDAMQHILFQSFARRLPEGERIVCDAEGYRATRAAELRAMARHAATRVRSSGQPFLFGPMSPEERRAIHMCLAEEDDLKTESVGEGNRRRLQVSFDYGKK
jgi:spoIIIJ-associated protein